MDSNVPEMPSELADVLEQLGSSFEAVNVANFWFVKDNNTGMFLQGAYSTSGVFMQDMVLVPEHESEYIRKR